MSGYHNVLLPEPFSKGSTFSVSFDTRTTVLENQREERVERGSAWGRRRYQLQQGHLRMNDLRGLREFYMQRRGSLNSFKFRDYQDWTTASDGMSEAISSTDNVLDAVIGGAARSYQLVKRYNDGVRTIVRPLEKIAASPTPLFQVNGIDVVPANYTLDYETGIVVFSASLDPITSVTGGCGFYVVTRFAESTDAAFSAVGQSTQNVATLPAIELIEDLADSAVSQDFWRGGGSSLGVLNTDINLTEVMGRVLAFTPATSGIKVFLPPMTNIAAGGPVFVLNNQSGVDSVEIRSSGDVLIATQPANSVRQVYAADLGGGSKMWLVS